MNHIFDLKLFDDQKDIFDPKFASTYFEKMSKKLGWEPQVSLEALDGEGSIEIPIRTQAGVFKIDLHDKAHGSVSTEDKAKLNINLEVPSTTSQSRVAAIVGAGLIEVGELPQELRAICLYKDVSVLNIDQRHKGIEQIFRSTTTLTDVEKSYVRSLIRSFSFIEDQTYLERIVRNFVSDLKKAGLGDFIVGALLLHDAEYKSDILLKVLPELIVHKLITVDQALLLIEKGMSDSSESIRFFVKTMKSFKFLVVENLITVDQVLPLIEREMSSLDYNVRFFGMEEIKSLADKDLITADQALPFFEKGMNDIDSNVRYSAVEAIKSLVDKTMITQSELEYLQKAALKKKTTKVK